MSYLRAPIDVDLQDLIDRALERIADQVPGWVPREGHLEVAVIEELARLVVETYAVAADVPDRIFSAYGREMHGITQGAGAAAVGTVRFTATDTAGYNVPAGTLVAWRVTGDQRIYFTTNATVTIPPGSNTGTVAVTAETDGEDGNGLGPGEVEIVDGLAFLDSAELLDATGGGEDPETDEAYRDRLADELRLLAPRPILPADFAVFARQTPGVHRALVLDLYDPTDQSNDNPRTVTLVPVGADGTPPGSEVLDQLIADMQARREVNFVIHTTGPNYTPVDVAFTIEPADDWDDPDAVDAAEQAVADWISPARWGGGDQSPPVWQLTDTVGYLELAAVLSSLDAVRRVVTLTINGQPDDLNLPDVAPLPAPLDDPTDPSTITGQVAT